jgi:hypothetical protein
VLNEKGAKLNSTILIATDKVKIALRRRAPLTAHDFARFHEKPLNWHDNAHKQQDDLPYGRRYSQAFGELRQSPMID